MIYKLFIALFSKICTEINFVDYLLFIFYLLCSVALVGAFRSATDFAFDVTTIIEFTFASLDFLVDYNAMATTAT